MSESTDVNSAMIEKVNIESLKRRIADISTLPLDRHSQEFEDIHGDLQRALTQIDGL